MVVIQSTRSLKDLIDSEVVPTHTIRTITRKDTGELELEKLSLDLRGFLLDQRLTMLASDLVEAGIKDLDGLLNMDRSALGDLDHDILSKLSASEVVKYQQRSDRLATQLLGDSNRHFIFLSHCKRDAGTEAALMVSEICNMLKDEPSLPGGSYETPVFLDSENLHDLKQLQEQVRNCANLVLMCTTNVLSSAWCLVEIVTAMDAGVPVLPLIVQKPDNSFEFPNNHFYELLCRGDVLDETSMETMRHCGIMLQRAATAIKHVFMTIALPYSPHKSKLMREAELKAMLERLKPDTIKAGRAASGRSGRASATTSRRKGRASV